MLSIGSKKTGQTLTEEEFQKAKKNLDDLWPQMDTVLIDEMEAGELAIKHVIRGFDAIHLAAALEIRTSAGKDTKVMFCSFDDRQNVEARAETLGVIEAEQRPR